MRYHYEKPYIYLSMYGERYVCDHPLYDKCTLFRIDEKGIAVIQQRFDRRTKTTWWGPIDMWVTDELYLHPEFKEYFDTYASEPIGDIFPTVTIRSIMWSLKMKPLPKQPWETVFDRRLL